MGAAHMFSFVLGLSSNSLVRSVLFLFGLPGAWQSSSTGVFTLDDPSQETHAGIFGNDGSMCDAMDGMGCNAFINKNDRATGVVAGKNTHKTASQIVQAYRGKVPGTVGQ